MSGHAPPKKTIAWIRRHGAGHGYSAKPLWAKYQAALGVPPVPETVFRTAVWRAKHEAIERDEWGESSVVDDDLSSLRDAIAEESRAARAFFTGE